MLFGETATCSECRRQLLPFHQHDSMIRSIKMRESQNESEETEMHESDTKAIHDLVES
jgi:hypothetical protein